MRNSQSDVCTLDSDCPLFDYNVEIPEIQERLSYWFETNAINDHNNANRTEDVIVNINIEGSNINSSNLIHENVLGGNQGHMPKNFFDSVFGFFENTDQSLEYHAYTSKESFTFYLIGGEVIDTYIASSSAASSTRTVALPLGVVNNGNTTSQTSDSIEVYFPETGR